MLKKKTDMKTKVLLFTIQIRKNILRWEKSFWEFKILKY